MKSILFNYRLKKSKVLNEIIPFYIEGFYNNKVTGYTLAFEKIDSNVWFNEFKSKVLSTSDVFFPICRLSDGEYLFICGNQPPIKISLIRQFIATCIFYFNSIRPLKNFEAGQARLYDSGKYLRSEIKNMLPKYLSNLKLLSDKGVLALHLTYTDNPFQERYHFKLKKIFDQYEIQINKNNYFPFYFVYAFFQTEEFKIFLSNKKILFFAGAENEKIKQVEKKFTSFGVSSIEFYKISKNRSLYDVVDLDIIKTKDVDICFVAAGIGKPNIMVQLEPLNCLCIDVGYMFEAWANEDLAYDRPWCSKSFKFS